MLSPRTGSHECGDNKVIYQANHQATHHHHQAHPLVTTASRAGTLVGSPLTVLYCASTLHAPALGGSGLCCDSSCIIRTRATSTDPQISCQSLLAGGWWVQACGGWVVKTPGPQPGHRGPRPATAPAPSSAQSREDRGERCLCDGRWLTHTGHQRA